MAGYVNIADVLDILHDHHMENPLRRLITLPLPAITAVLSLALLPSISVYLWSGIRTWQMGDSPAFALTDRFFWTIGVGRSIGGFFLAVLLLYWRRPASVAVTITGVWLAGPPLTFLWRGIDVLAASAGQSSWAGGVLDWIVLAVLFPGLITAALLIPPSARHAYAIS
jgi:hypothetical protein